MPATLRRPPGQGKQTVVWDFSRATRISARRGTMRLLSATNSQATVITEQRALVMAGQIEEDALHVSFGQAHLLPQIARTTETRAVDHQTKGIFQLLHSGLKSAPGSLQATGFELLRWRIGPRPGLRLFIEERFQARGRHRTVRQLILQQNRHGDPAGRTQKALHSETLASGRLGKALIPAVAMQPAWTLGTRRAVTVEYPGSNLNANEKPESNRQRNYIILPDPRILLHDPTRLRPASLTTNHRTAAQQSRRHINHQP